LLGPRDGVGPRRTCPGTDLSRLFRSSAYDRRCSRSRLPVALVTLAALRLRFRAHPTICGEGPPDVIRFLELTLRVPPHVPLVRAGVDQLPLRRLAPFPACLARVRPFYGSSPCSVSPSAPPGPSRCDFTRKLRMNSSPMPTSPMPTKKVKADSSSRCCTSVRTLCRMTDRPRSSP
jgi:hypothetical protein